MVEFRVKVRSEESVDWNLLRQRKSIAGDPTKLRGTDRPAELARMVALRQSQSIFPKMLDVEGQTFKRIMVGELTGIEGARFLRPEDVSGHNGVELQLRLREPSSNPLNYVNVDDQKRYIETANGQGKKFRFMTDAEFEALPPEVKSQLKGTNWFLVETSRGSKQYYWRSLNNAYWYDYGPDRRFSSLAVRLVED